MNKSEANKIITQSLDKIYGFAVSRTHDINDAKELSSEIVFEVYKSLLKQDNIVNINAYIWRISKNVYAHFTNEKKFSFSSDNMEYIPANDNFAEEIEKSETMGILRREITYLAETERKITILRYYEDKKVKEISKILDIPENTVKWHLSMSRKEIKKGMEKIRTTGETGIKPIRLINLSHSGTPGEKGDTSTFLAKSLTQNIAYAAYQKPRNINEIADELGVNPIFIKDEIDVLEEYGFMDKLPDGRYQTNIYIRIPSKEAYSVYNKIDFEYTELFTEKFFKPELEKITEIPDYLSVPDNDVNLLKWLITFKLAEKLIISSAADFEKYCVKRPDGGNYIAQAELLTEDTEEENVYWCCGPMTREINNDNMSIKSYQINCRFTDRIGGWKDNLDSDYSKLYFYLSGHLEEKPENVASYKRLLDKGYLIKTDSGYKCNIITCHDESKWEKSISKAPEEIKKLCYDYAKETAKADLLRQPPHMYPLIKDFSKNSAYGLKTKIAENLLNKGILKEPTAKQKKGLLTILFIK